MRAVPQTSEIALNLDEDTVRRQFSGARLITVIDGENQTTTSAGKQSDATDAATALR
jgi:hypothetical protein